jgi:predicted acyltransferase
LHPDGLVFPFFLFIIGVAIAFSFSKYKENKLTLGLGHTVPLGRILRRSAILFALGLLLNGFWNYNWSTIRIMGVLQRISLAYLLATLVILKLPRKGQWAIALLLLLGYGLPCLLFQFQVMEWKLIARR